MNLNRSISIYLILHDIRSVQNVGSIFRTADCAGVKKIYFTGYTPAPIDRFGRKRQDISKVALGAEKNIEWEAVKDIKKLVSKLKKEKVSIVSLEQSKRSVDYKKVTKKINKKSFALIVGSEVEGISERVLKLSDFVAEISMRGKKESLNVSVATGIALFRILDI